MSYPHCRDCCCARSWKALGISEYTGNSIPEHISGLRTKASRLQEALKRITDYPAGAESLLEIRRIADAALLECEQ